MGGSDDGSRTPHLSPGEGTHQLTTPRPCLSRRAAYEPLSLLVEIVARPPVAQPSTAYKSTSAELTLDSDSDSDDDSIQIPPSRQPSSARPSSTRTMQSVEVVEIDDDSESEPPPYEPVPRRRAGYGLDTPDLFSDTDDIEVVEPEPEPEPEPSDAEFEHRERMSPEFDVQSWSAAGSPDAEEPTQDYAFAYRYDEPMPTHEDVAFENDSDAARSEEGGEPYFAEDDNAVIELEPLDRKSVV